MSSRPMPRRNRRYREPLSKAARRFIWAGGLVVGLSTLTGAHLWLVGQLRAEDKDTRLQAVHLLLAIRDVWAIPALLSYAGEHPDATTDPRLEPALGRIGPPALPFVLWTLRRYPGVCDAPQRAALQVLGYMGPVGTRTLLWLSRVKGGDADLLYRYCQDARSAPLLVRLALSSPPSPVSYSAANSLTNLGPAAAPPLIARLTHGTPAERQQARELLGSALHRGSSHAYPALPSRAARTLVRLAASPDPLTARTATEALALADHPRAMPALVRLLASAAPDDAAAAAEILGEQLDRHTEWGADPDVQTALTQALRSSGIEVRAHAARALSNIAAHAVTQRLNPAAVAPGLEQASGDRSPEVRREALRGLAALPGGTQRLARALADSDQSVRLEAVAVLARQPDPGAWAPLFAATRAGDSAVRIRALCVLGETRDPRAYPALATAFRDPRQRIRLEAGRALARLPGPQAHALMLAALVDPLVGVRRVAAEHFIEVPDVAAEGRLLAALQTADGPIRTAASVALAQLHTVSADRALARVVGCPDIPIVAQRYQAILRVHGAGREGALIRALQDHGSAQMAEDYLNDHGWADAISAAAATWAKAHRYEIRPKFG